MVSKSVWFSENGFDVALGFAGYAFAPHAARSSVITNERLHLIALGAAKAILHDLGTCPCAVFALVKAAWLEFEIASRGGHDL